MTAARWTGLAVAVLAAAVYANAAANGFALDDEFIIVANERVHGIDRIPRAVTEPYWPGAPGDIGLYRPLTAVSFAVEWELWGENPLPFHVTNIVLHVVATLLVFAILAGLVGVPGAAIGAGLFAVHPVHVEAVANTVGRGELLAAVLVLAAALLYLRMELRSRRRLWGTAALLAGAYFLGLAAKEIAVTLPGLLLLLEAARGGPNGEEREDVGRSSMADVRALGARLWRSWPVYGALAVALAGYLALRGAALGTAVGNDAAPFFAPLSTGERILTAIAVWPEYLRLMVFPVELVADYSPAVLVPVGGFGPAVLAGLLVAALAALVVAVAWQRERAVALGILWFALAVLPVSNLIFPIGILLAERTLYLPSVGLALVAGGVVRQAWGSDRWRRPAIAAAVLLGVLAAARTWVRTPTWRTTSTVMNTLVRQHPESFRAQWVLADQALDTGHYDEAVARYQTAVRLMPYHYQLRISYGRTLAQLGRPEDAATSFLFARDANPELVDAHIHLMVALLAAGRPDDAVEAGHLALRWHPDHRGVHHQLAIALTRAGRYEDALDARRQSIRLAGPRAAPLQYVHEAELLVRLGQVDAARAALANARERTTDPASIPSLTSLREAISTANPAALPYR